MRKIWKFDLAITERQRVQMPVDATFLSIKEVDRVDGTHAAMWWLVDPESPALYREIDMVGTGHDVPHVGDYLGTIVLKQGALVLHVFTGPGDGSGFSQRPAFHHITSGRAG